MKLELDFENKIVSVKGTVKVEDLIQKVKELKLSDWTIKQEIEYLQNPVYIPYVQTPEIKPLEPYYYEHYDPFTVFCGAYNINGIETEITVN